MDVLASNENTASCPSFVGTSGCFQVSVNEKLLAQACDDLCEIMIAHQLWKRQSDLRRIYQRRTHAMNSKARRCLIWTCILVTGVWLGVSLYFGETSAIYFLGPLLIFFACIELPFVSDKRFRRCVEAVFRPLDRLTDCFIRSSYRITFRRLRDKTPYVVKYELKQRTWSSVSAVRGRNNLSLQSPMFAWKSVSHYVILKSKMSQKMLFTMLAETDEQRSLIEANLSGNGIPCLDLSSIPTEVTEFVE